MTSSSSTHGLLLFCWAVFTGALQMLPLLRRSFACVILARRTLNIYAACVYESRSHWSVVIESGFVATFPPNVTVCCNSTFHML